MLVIATHPDDAEIAAFGLYSGRRSFVATVSAGNSIDGLYSDLAPDRDEQIRIRGLARAWDSLVVPTWGDVPPKRIVNLGYWNGSLQDLHQRRDQRAASDSVLIQDPNLYRSGAIAELVGNRRAEATWRSLVSDLAAIIAAVTPTVIVAPHPALDAAKDHQYTTLALLEALDAVGDDSAVLLLYTNHHVHSEYFPFGPAGSAVDLPPWLDRSVDYFGIYAYWLTEGEQMRKLFALEAMHDLRAAPRLPTGGPTGRFLGRINAALHDLIRNPLDTYSYIRRAVRSNEIFFVVAPGDRLRVEEYFAFPKTGQAMAGY
jgi:LmbE family N-acetylglucosaminyl deacetylase